MVKIPSAGDSPTNRAALTDNSVPAAAALKRWSSHATEPHILFPANAVLALSAIWGTTLNLI
jgi:hypothetical protein